MMEFKITSLNLPNYNSKTINLLVPCPEWYGDNFFDKGEFYTVRFFDDCKDRCFDLFICNELEYSKRKRLKRRFWINSIEKKG